MKVVLLGIALVESFGYRKLSSIWRLRGLAAAVRRDGTWGEMERTGFDAAATEAVHHS